MRKAELLKIKDIVVTGRHRKEFGHIDTLVASISDVGLLQPIGVDSRMHLIWGERRLRACKKLGWESIPAVIDASFDDAVRAIKAERDENTCRKDLLPSEAARLGEQLEELERKEAKQRQNAGLKQGKTLRSGKLPERVKGDVRDKVASALGVSGRTYEKAKAVAAKGDPKLIDAMDKGDVSIDAAAAVATLPKPDQAWVVGMGPKATLAKAKEIKAEQSQKRQQKRLAEMAKKAEQQSAAVGATRYDWRIEHGDCLTILRRLKDRPRLIFADPPYNIGVDYGDGEKADLLSDAKYISWCKAWMERCAEMLTPDGSFWVMICDEYAGEFAVTLKSLGLTIQNWIKWYETFGVNCADKFNRTSRHIFYCLKNPNQRIFNTHAIQRPSARQVLYNDGRAAEGGKLWDDVWTIPRLVGTSTERIPSFPTQLPLALLKTIVQVGTEPGDLVIDPFNGSGTTGAASLELGRRYIGIEQSEEFAKLARQRLTGIGGPESKAA